MVNCQGPPDVISAETLWWSPGARDSVGRGDLEQCSYKTGGGWRSGTGPRRGSVLKRHTGLPTVLRNCVLGGYQSLPAWNGASENRCLQAQSTPSLP